MIEKQELYCHNCNRYVQFDLNLSLNGNHVLMCPVCRHEHCRVVEDGKITSDRWDSRNGNAGWGLYNIQASGTSVDSTYDTFAGSTDFYQSWMNTTTSTGT